MKIKELNSHKKKAISYLLICLIMIGMHVSTLSSEAWGEDKYPTKKIAWLLPYKPGGGFDIFARSLSPYLTKNLKLLSPNTNGGEVVIKNEPAAAGEKAIFTLYNAPPDGYTIGAFTGAFLADQFLTKKDYDLTKLSYLIRLDEMTRVLVTRKSGPKNWQEVITASKSSPIKWGVGAFGREIHIMSIIANEALGLPVKFIAFGGTAENLNALIRGDIQMASVSEDSAKALIDAGEIRVVLSFDKKSSYPAAVSIQDLGHPELINPSMGERFLAGPPNLPKKIAKNIVEAFQKACNDRAFVAWSKKTGFEPNLLYGKDLENLIKELSGFYKDKAPLIKMRID
ncbi:MAG: tripartite tricarboxylate transporter substrate binding protein [Sideroxyarcus sp.]|nr:tripartite tricarboxylate transporter substrate binding protein [Sideroxyarcus sp.]